MTEKITSEKLIIAAGLSVDKNLPGKKRIKKKSIMGIDPLAWLKEEHEVEKCNLRQEDTTGQDRAGDAEQKLQEDNLEDKADIDKPDLEEIIETVEEIIPKKTQNETVEITDQIDDQRNDQAEVMDMDNMEVQQSGEKFKLEGAITIADVSELHDQFKIFLAQGQDLKIDCSEISSIDAAALQLLVAFVHESDKENSKIIWQEPSDTFEATVQMMGLKNEFRM